MERYAIYADGVRIGHAETNKKAWEIANEYVYECMTQAERHCPEMEVHKEGTYNTMKVINDLIYALSKTIENGEFANALEMAIERRKYDDNDKQKVLEKIENCRFVFAFAFGFLNQVEPVDVTERRRERQRIERATKEHGDFAEELVKEIEDDIKKQEEMAQTAGDTGKLFTPTSYPLDLKTWDDFLAAFKKERDERWRNKMKEEERAQTTEDTSKLNNIVWREGILDEAKRCVCGKREQDYGTPENNFATIADFWNTYLGGRLSPDNPINSHDVGIMMALLKIARIKSGGTAAGSMDNYIDLAGYAACAGEMYAYLKD